MKKGLTVYRPHVISVRFTEEENIRLQHILAIQNDKGHRISRSEYIREKTFSPNTGAEVKAARDEIKRFRVEFYYMSKELKRGVDQKEIRELLSRCINVIEGLSKRLPDIQEGDYGSDST
ncbi:MAG: hypothetical protein K6F00_02300 [Lachnospiraceae bacterium]|nr:hypothetical protein [Lachnospiraceae bacterium]